MTAKNQIYFWAATFAAFFAFVYLFKSVLLPFVLGGLIAYLLNPLVLAFGKLKINRTIAALIILLVFFTSTTLAIALAAPLLYNQSLQLISDAPDYAVNIWELIQPFIIQVSERLGLESIESVDIKSLITNNSETAADIAKRVLNKIAQGGQAFISAITTIVFTPIVAYFVMKEWVRITSWVEDLLPRDKKETILSLLKQIDMKISGFVRGQVSVALILAVGYAIALSIAGLKYGALIGIAAGLLSIIPMVGSALGLVTSVVVAYFQSFDLSYTAIIAAIFLVGQFIEGNILSPKIVGDSVGLHPLWVFFALLAGGALFGIVGMLIAVPVAAIAGVLLAFAILQYKSSPLYKGKSKPTAKKKPAKGKN